MKSNLMLLVAAAIWGFGFVAQRLGMNFLEPFAFNTMRFLLGSISLLPLLCFLSRKAPVEVVHKSNKPPLLKGGVLCGLVLFVAATLQQYGLFYTTAAKAGFITGLYLILVPMLGILLRHKTGLTIWLGAALALAGLYLLSVNDNFTMSFGDSLIFIGSLFWAFHILVIDRFSGRVDPIQLSAVQFLICGLLSLGVSLVIETPTLNNIVACWKPILFAGIVSVGIAYTLQVIAQKNANPSHAAIIMSLEAVFAAIGGVWLLDETLSTRAWFGCGLMMAGMLLSQVKFKNNMHPAK
ncbi:MAG: DMT family transporter [Gammaproteobacteria bacterium]|nr:MAG: DMT family transporter [Gammaproteobacteria bacterium]